MICLLKTREIIVSAQHVLNLISPAFIIKLRFILGRGLQLCRLRPPTAFVFLVNCGFYWEDVVGGCWAGRTVKVDIRLSSFHHVSEWVMLVCVYFFIRTLFCPLAPVYRSVSMGSQNIPLKLYFSLIYSIFLSIQVIHLGIGIYIYKSLTTVEHNAILYNCSIQYVWLGTNVCSAESGIIISLM